MYLRTLLILIVLGVLSIFALINWSAFTAQTSLSVGFATVEAPLGLILLGITGLLALLFLVLPRVFAIVRAAGKPALCT